ncbi:hypothetical protein [Maritalea porphyrae]|jgi:hypothetical protein|uniref:hypothetical protein n=1 Tax=Maritalea porphyrae TaxID=880732 RepID=UPI0022AE9DED|nr:hypothetical protein [Maritalea porphyrae]MCZ4274099.1 hypothetical protein [Maritalea porphyrae]
METAFSMLVQLVAGGFGAVLIACIKREKHFNTAEITIVGALSGLVGYALISAIPAFGSYFSIAFMGEAVVGLGAGMLFGLAVFIVKDAIENATRES